jgi:hypothetical protein
MTPRRELAVDLLHYRHEVVPMLLIAPIVSLVIVVGGVGTFVTLAIARVRDLGSRF